MLQLCHSYNNYGQQEPPKDGLQNLTNLINREITQNKTNNNNSNNTVSSIALSALTALSAININTNTTNLSLEKGSKDNTNCEATAQYCLTSITKHAKLTPPLPQIHKLK